MKINKLTEETLIQDVSSTPEITEEDKNAAIANVIHDLVIEENASILSYRSAIETIKAEIENEELCGILEDIMNSKYNHLGSLQKAVEIIYPPAAELIDSGVDTAESDAALTNEFPTDDYVTESINLAVSLRRKEQKR